MLLSSVLVVAIVFAGTGLTSWMSPRLRFEERIAIGIVVGVLSLSVVTFSAFLVGGMGWAAVLAGVAVPGAVGTAGIILHRQRWAREATSAWQRLRLPSARSLSLRPFVVDDCSNDETLSILRAAAAEDQRVRVLVNEINRGHGPSVRRGADESQGAWILHLDSDGQIDPAEFPSLWSRRNDSDLVLGVRVRRDDPMIRLVLTRMTRGLVSLLARRRVRDANTPFRLVSRSLFEHLAPAIPQDTFAPAVLVVLGAHRCRAIVTEMPITHFARAHGTSSLHLRRLAAVVGRCTLQTLRFSRRHLDPYVRG